MTMAFSTALEASSLDLWGTRMAVLSACETGVGRNASRGRRLWLAPRARCGGRRKPGDESLAGQRRRHPRADDRLLHEVEGGRSAFSSASRRCSYRCCAPARGSIRTTGPASSCRVLTVRSRFSDAASSSAPQPGSGDAAAEQQQRSRFRDRPRSLNVRRGRSEVIGGCTETLTAPGHAETYPNWSTPTTFDCHPGDDECDLGVWVSE